LRRTSTCGLELGKPAENLSGIRVLAAAVALDDAERSAQERIPAGEVTHPNAKAPEHGLAPGRNGMTGSKSHTLNT